MMCPLRVKNLALSLFGGNNLYSISYTTCSCISPADTFAEFFSLAADWMLRLFT